MGLHKPSNIPKLEEILPEKALPENEISQLLESIGEFGNEKADKNILQTGKNLLNTTGVMWKLN